jgi:hypothetical protein
MDHLTYTWVIFKLFIMARLTEDWNGPRYNPGMISCASLRISYLISQLYARLASQPPDGHGIVVVLQ